MEQGADAGAVLAARRRAHELAREGLAETRRAVGALRGDARPTDDARAPARDRVAGRRLPLRRPMPRSAVSIDGDASPADRRRAGETVVRVVQESLTNVRKHAPGRAGDGRGARRRGDDRSDRAGRRERPAAGARRRLRPVGDRRRLRRAAGCASEPRRSAARWRRARPRRRLARRLRIPDVAPREPRDDRRSCPDERSDPSAGRRRPGARPRGTDDAAGGHAGDRAGRRRRRRRRGGRGCRPPPARGDADGPADAERRRRAGDSGIRAAQPETEIVVLTTHADEASILDALRAGARGYLTKDAGSRRSPGRSTPPPRTSRCSIPVVQAGC